MQPVWPDISLHVDLAVQADNSTEVLELPIIMPAKKKSEPTPRVQLWSVSRGTVMEGRSAQNLK